jgi:hypothetical protein
VEDKQEMTTSPSVEDLPKRELGGRFLPIIDGLGRPWFVVTGTCSGCGKETDLHAIVHKPDNDFDPGYCPDCYMRIRRGREEEEK